MWMGRYVPWISFSHWIFIFILPTFFSNQLVQQWVWECSTLYYYVYVIHYCYGCQITETISSNQTIVSFSDEITMHWILLKRKKNYPQRYLLFGYLKILLIVWSILHYSDHFSWFWLNFPHHFLYFLFLEACRYRICLCDWRSVIQTHLFIIIINLKHPTQCVMLYSCFLQ